MTSHRPPPTAHCSLPTAHCPPKVRVGVVGTGFGAMVHIPTFQLCADTEVVAVCSASPGRAEEVAKRFGIPYAFDDYRRLVELPDVDAVAVVVPPRLHHAVAMAALDAGKHVLCEKPFAMNVGEAEEIRRKAHAAGVVHMINHESRFSPSRSKVKELVDAGYIGDLIQVNSAAFYHHYRTNRTWDWHARREDGGGMMGARGSHTIDIMRHWFGEIAGCYGWVDTFIKKRRVPGTDDWRPATTDDGFAFMLDFRAGGRATVQLNTATLFGKGMRIEAYGVDGTLVIDFDNRVYGARAGEPGLAEIPLPPLTVPDDRLKVPVDQIDFGQFLEDRGPDWGGYTAAGPRNLSILIFDCLRLAQRFVEGIREGGNPTPSFDDGVRCQEVMDAVFLSSAEQRWVGLPLSDAALKGGPMPASDNLA